MKVLHIIDHWGLGGAQRALATLVRREPVHRHHIATLFSHGAHPWALPPGCPFVYLGGGYSALPLLPFRLRRLIRRTEPDVLHVHLNGARIVTGMALQSLENPPRLVWHEHSGEEIRMGLGPWRGRLAARWLRGLARRVDGFVANSAHSRGFCESTWRASPDRVALLHCPVDGEEVRAGAALPIRDRPAEADPRFTEIVGFVGRLAPQKGIRDLLDFAPSLLARRPQCQVWIVGDGPQRHLLQKEAQRKGLAGRIVFWGVRTEIFPIMNAISVVVMPSRFEPFGLVAAEAFILGKPVVGYDVDGLSELLAENPLGVPVPPGDRALLAGKIEEVLDKRPSPGVSSRIPYEEDALIGKWSDYYSRLAKK